IGIREWTHHPPIPDSQPLRRERDQAPYVIVVIRCDECGDLTFTASCQSLPSVADLQLFSYQTKPPALRRENLRVCLFFVCLLDTVRLARSDAFYIGPCHRRYQISSKNRLP